MVTKGKVAKYEFRLQTHAGTETVGYFAFTQIGLAIVSNVLCILTGKVLVDSGVCTVVVHIRTQSYTEYAVRLPVGGYPDGGCRKPVTVFVIDTACTRSESEVYTPLFGNAVVQFGGNIRVGLIVVETARLVLRCVGYSRFYIKHVVTAVGSHHTAVAQVLPTARECEIPTLHQLDINIQPACQKDVRYTAY